MSEISFAGLEPKYGQGWFLLKAQGEKSIPGLFQLLEAAGIP